MPQGNKARAPQLLSQRATTTEVRAPQLLSSRTTTTEASTPTVCAPQQEKPPQWEDRAPQQRVAPAGPN